MWMDELHSGAQIDHITSPRCFRPYSRPRMISTETTSLIIHYECQNVYILALTHATVGPIYPKDSVHNRHFSCCALIRVSQHFGM